MDESSRVEVVVVPIQLKLDVGKQLEDELSLYLSNLKLVVGKQLKWALLLYLSKLDVGKQLWMSRVGVVVVPVQLKLDVGKQLEERLSLYLSNLKLVVGKQLQLLQYLFNMNVGKQLLDESIHQLSLYLSNLKLDVGKQLKSCRCTYPI